MVHSGLSLTRLAGRGVVGANGLAAPLFPLGFALAYFLAAKLGIATSLPPEGIVILWPPNAVVLAALLAVQRSRWWLLFLVTLATEIAADVPHYPLWAAAGYGIVNFSEAALAALLLSKFARGGARLLSRGDFLRFIAVGPVLASGTAALLGAAIYKIGAPELDYLHYWRVFWLGDALGLLTIGTALLAWKRPPVLPGRLTLVVATEAAVLLLGLLAVSGWGFTAETQMPRLYLIFPFLVWAALRFGVRGASVAVLAVTAIAIGSAVAGRGPFGALSHIDAVVALQGLIAVVALSTFMLAFVTEASVRTTAELRRAVERQREAETELRNANDRLEAANRDLDATVAERTGHLRRALSRNEMLLQEVHHRVKNNLQIVTGLLALRGRGMSDPALRREFDEVRGQVSSIASTYDLLHRLGDAEAVDFCAVVPALCHNISEASGAHVTVEATTDGAAPVSADKAVALALALNELVTNSVKHAGGAVAIAVACRRDGGDALLTVADDGDGFPPGFDLDRAKGFGMGMVRGLVDEARGRIRLVGSRTGAVVEIRVPAASGGEAAAE